MRFSSIVSSIHPASLLIVTILATTKDNQSTVHSSNSVNSLDVNIDVDLEAELDHR